MKNLQTYYSKKMSNPNLGIDIFLAENYKKGVKFNTHWHEHMQLYFFTKGSALVERSFRYCPYKYLSFL